MQLEIKGNQLTITVPLGKGEPSKSGKNTTLFTTHGNLHTSAVYNGKPVTVGVNVYIPAN